MRTPTGARLVPLALAAFALVGCRSDTPGASAEPLGPASPAPLFAAAEAQRFSEWSEPVHLGSIVNTRFVDSDPFISRDGLSLLRCRPRPRWLRGEGPLGLPTRQRRRPMGTT